MKKFTSIILICVLILAYTMPAMGADIKDAFGTISTSELDSVANGTVNTSTGVLGYTGSTTRACFKNVNFSKKAVSVELYSGTGPDSAGAIISVHLDSESGTKLASVPINACGWGNYEWNTAPISAEISGTHDIWLVWETSAANFVEMKFVAETNNTTGFLEYKNKSSYSDIADTPYSYQIEVMKGLGFFENFNNDEFQPNLPVKRDEFADVLYRLYDEKPSQNVSDIFRDVDDSCEQGKAIAGLYEKGIVLGGDNSEFRPDDFISINDAIVMIARALGYSYFAEQNGGYHIGHVKMAADAGVKAPAAIDQNLRRGEMASLIYDTINADYLLESYEDVRRVIKKEKGILKHTKKINAAKGIVTATGCTGLYSAQDNTSVGYVKIDDRMFSSDGTDADSMIGMMCEYYYSENDGEDCLKYIIPYRNDIITIGNGTQYKIDNITSSEISYSLNNKKQKIKLGSKTNIIYNSKAAETGIADIVNSTDDFRGYIMYIKNSEEETVVIMEHRNIVVDYYNENKNIIKDKLSKNDIDLSKFDKIYTERDGKIIDVSNIGKNIPIIAYESKNTSGESILILKLYSDYETEGEVTSVSDDKIIIDGKEYLAAKEADKIESGMKKCFWINQFAEIVYFETGKGTSNYQLGCILGIWQDDSGESVVARVFAESNETEDLRCSDNVKIDGVTYKSADKAFAALKKADMNSLIRYRLNTKGDISVLDTYISGNGGEGDKIRRLNDTSLNFRYSSEEKTLLRQGQGVYPVSDDAKCISLWYDKELYKFETINNALSTGYDLKGTAYTLNDDDLVDVFICENKNRTKVNPTAVVFDSFIETLNDDGEAVKTFVVHENGKIKQYPINSVALGKSAELSSNLEDGVRLLKRGDVIRVYANERGEADKITIDALVDLKANRSISEAGKTYTLTANISENTPQSGSYDQQERYSCGVVDKISDGFVRFVLSDGTTEYIRLTGSVYKYETASDLIYDNIGIDDVSEGDSIILWKWYGYKTVMVIE